ncbi:hypothetical protein [Virgibacillus siamensis]|nr:hypothetical protein [Virgibacillus siamensis]
MNYERGGIAFTGCVVLGVGIGMLFGNAAAGSLIGVGVGFLAMALFGKR